MMLYVNNQNEQDPALNLALEEHILRNAQTGEDLLLLYINEPSIIIGRHQNAFEEINRTYVEKHGIHVVRRLSGGGTVYHDLGNLNYSFITEALPENFRNFKKFTAPVVQALAALGVPAELNGRNDLLIDGRKISGTAQYITKGRMVSHGTLLFNSDLEHITEALHAPQAMMTSKAIKSVRSRVANISEFLNQPMPIETFKEKILTHVFPGVVPIPEYALGIQDWTAVRRLAAERYRNWDWNYGHSPDFAVEKHQLFPGGGMHAHFEVKDGVIQSAKLSGDFFAGVAPEPLERCLIGVRYREDDISRALLQENIAQVYPGVAMQAFCTFVLS
jgi:lipoate---protein ligase